MKQHGYVTPSWRKCLYLSWLEQLQHISFLEIAKQDTSIGSVIDKFAPTYELIV